MRLGLTMFVAVLISNGSFQNQKLILIRNLIRCWYSFILCIIQLLSNRSWRINITEQGFGHRFDETTALVHFKQIQIFFRGACLKATHSKWCYSKHPSERMQSFTTRLSHVPQVNRFFSVLRSSHVIFPKSSVRLSNQWWPWISRWSVSEFSSLHRRKCRSRWSEIHANKNVAICNVYAGNRQL